jgi:hypothetical protein
MTDNITPEFDAAILHVVNQQLLEADQKPISKLGHIGETKKFVGGIIAKLLEGMERPDWFTTDEDCGWDAALTEIRRRAGLEDLV